MQHAVNEPRSERILEWVSTLRHLLAVYTLYVLARVLGGGKGGFHGLDSAVHAKPGLQDGGSTHDKCRPLSIRPLRYIERRCRAVEHLGTPWAVALQLSTEVESIFTS